MLSITLWAKKLQISYHLLALKCRNRGESDSMKRWLVCSSIERYYRWNCYKADISLPFIITLQLIFF